MSDQAAYCERCERAAVQPAVNRLGYFALICLACGWARVPVAHA